jgi:cytochrome c nitrite reductase small subunit
LDDRFQVILKRWQCIETNKVGGLLVENNERQRKTFRERFLNRKTLIIIAALIIVVGAGGAAALVKASDYPAFCNTCHIMKSYYTSWHDSNLLANQHAEADVECHDCHQATIATQAHEGIAYITGNYKTPLEKRQFSRDFCLKCHSESGGATTFEQAKAATNFEESNPHDSHNGEQDCTLCHNMHRQSEVMCAQCHHFDWMNDLDESWAK